jgi:intracellular sulfur oxidation DsrE/DsrF family protein
MPDRTVFHIPEGAESYGRKALRNVANLLADGSIDPDIAIVANAGGIAHLLSDALTADSVRDLLDDGVEVCACRNSIEGSEEYTTKELVDGVVVVS